jgi:hypothetical protein
MDNIHPGLLHTQIYNVYTKPGIHHSSTYHTYNISDITKQPGQKQYSCTVCISFAVLNASCSDKTAVLHRTPQV